MDEKQFQQEILAAVEKIRDGQQEIVSLLSAQRSLTEAQLERSRQSVAESIELQKLALQRQRSITLIAVPGILACIAAIAYLVIRYF